MTTAMPAARTERWARMHIEMFHSSGTGRPSRRDGQPIRSQLPARAGLLIGSPT